MSQFASARSAIAIAATILAFSPLQQAFANPTGVYFRGECKGDNEIVLNDFVGDDNPVNQFSASGKVLQTTLPPSGNIPVSGGLHVKVLGLNPIALPNKGLDYVSFRIDPGNTPLTDIHLTMKMVPAAGITGSRSFLLSELVENPKVQQHGWRTVTFKSDGSYGEGGSHLVPDVYLWVHSWKEQTPRSVKFGRVTIKQIGQAACDGGDLKFKIDNFCGLGY